MIYALAVKGEFTEMNALAPSGGHCGNNTNYDLLVCQKIDAQS